MWAWMHVDVDTCEMVCGWMWKGVGMGMYIWGERVCQWVAGRTEDEAHTYFLATFHLCVSSLLLKFMTVGRSHYWRPRHFN